MNTTSNPPVEQSDALTTANAKTGLWLFFLYFTLYLVFMLLHAFVPESMAYVIPGLGINLAIVYGLLLIVAAVILSLVYMILCNRNEKRLRDTK